MTDDKRIETEATVGNGPPRYTVEELFRGKSADEWRQAYCKAYDWGPDIGREIVEE